MLKAALFIIAKKYKQPKYLFNQLKVLREKTEVPQESGNSASRLGSDLN